MPAKRKRTTKQKPVESVEELNVRICTGEKALTVEQAKELIGWEEERDKKFGTDYLLKNSEKKKIRCSNNLTNRPLYLSVCKGLVQDILNGHWRFNGEPIIVGKDGSILNGQHTLVSLILAGEIWRNNRELYSLECEPTIERLVVYGVSNDDKTINTMDTCKPRSLQDVIYRSRFFKECSSSERKKVSRTCSYAIKLIWERIGLRTNRSVSMTHAELLAFLENHLRIIEAVKFLQIESGHENLLSNISPLGSLSGMFYLMASSSSRAPDYKKVSTEESLNFENWDKVEEFFVLLSSSSDAAKPLYRRIAELPSSGCKEERLSLIAKSWNGFAAEGKIPSKLDLKYVTKEGMRVLAEHPTVGGVDGLFWQK